ncbi:MAG TPA: hypothetical protein ENN69_00540, partial [Spirochaetia bacterium]|nr:hypothetical protein [Spirochaetia bacterium]
MPPLSKSAGLDFPHPLLINIGHFRSPHQLFQANGFYLQYGDTGTIVWTEEGTTRMKRFPRFLAAGFAVSVLAIELAFFIIDAAQPEGVKLSAPRDGLAYPIPLPVEGIAWYHGDQDYRVTLTASRDNEPPLVVDIPREAVVYEGKTAFLLASFRTQLALPEEGTWELSFTVIGPDGGCVWGEPISITAGGEQPTVAFRHFSVQHLAALAGVLAAVIVVLALSRTLDPKMKTGLEFALVLVLWLNEISYQLYWYLTGGWYAATALIVQMCGLSIIMLFIVFALPEGKIRRIMYELIYFWGLGGALQALLTPDIGFRGFPDYK